MQFWGTINNSGREFISTTTQKELREGKMNQGKLSEERQLIGSYDL